MRSTCFPLQGDGWKEALGGQCLTHLGEDPVNHLINEPTTQSIVLDHGIRHDLRNLIACLGLDVELLSRIGKEDGQKYLRNAGARAMKSMQRIEALLLNVQSPMLVRSDFD